MIYNQFPDLKWLKSQVEENFANQKGIAGRPLVNKGWPTVILNVGAQNIYRDDIRGPVSIFANISGGSLVSVNGKSTFVKDDVFFITNHDQRYTLQIDETKTTTFNIHFGEYFTEQVYDAIARNPSSCLDDDKFTPPIDRINFHNKLYLKSDHFNRVAKEILQSKGNDLLAEEKLFELMLILLREQTQILRDTATIPTIKKSTREEIMKRLFLATDYIYSYSDVDLNLDQLAAISCLSKFHFLRLFKVAFRQTPHQFITAVKLSRAKELLKRTSLEINNIAKQVGYRDSSSFSRTFFNEVGVYPTQFRNSF